MDLLAVLPSKAIPSVLPPTFQIFSPLLASNASSILSTPRKTHTYGPHPRQTLDLYSPQTVTATPPPILIFLYGGGLTRGDKILGQEPTSVPSSLIYHNLGAFFAQRGFTTVIPDYRRVNDAAARTGEGAVYPSGGEDVAAVLEWMHTNPAVAPVRNENDVAPGAPPRDVFILGNSAGGVHLATYLLDPRFQGSRDAMSATRGVDTTRRSLRLRGAVLLSAPLDFESAAPGRRQGLGAYWPGRLVGDGVAHELSVERFCPAGLLRAVRGGGETGGVVTPADVGVPDVLLLLAERDPEGEITGPNERFLAAWKDRFGGTNGIEVKWLRGHNHISPPVALMSGDAGGEEWGDELVVWMRDRVE